MSVELNEAEEAEVELEQWLVEQAEDGAPKSSSSDCFETTRTTLNTSGTCHECGDKTTTEPEITTGHTWITASEIPDRILSKAASGLINGLMAAKDRYGPDRARLVVWLRYSAE